MILIHTYREQRSGPDNSWSGLTVDGWSDLTVDGWGKMPATASASNYDRQYQYDSVLNRTVKVIDGVRTTSTFDPANQLQVELTGSNRTTFTFDANGNKILVLQPDGSRTTTLWSYENDSIVIATPANGIQTSAYNPDNLRAKKEDADGTKHFIYDDQAYLLETNSSSITVTVYTQEPTTYGYLASQYRFDGSIWKPSYYHQDALGSTMQLTDDSEDVIDTFVYDAWGVLVDRTGTTETPFQWIGAWGYYKDEATGLYYVRRRSLRPSTGRWTSPDPLLFVDGPNLYVAYFVPFYVDPDGTNPTAVIIGGGATAVGAAIGSPAVATGAAISAAALASLAVCMGPHFLYVRGQAGSVWMNDKWAHCVVSCRASKTCSSLISAVGGLSFEVLQGVQKALGMSGTDGFSLGDMSANAVGIGCAGFESWCPVIGPLIGLAFRDSCAVCCDKKFGSF